jgi:hypothetical protein
VSSRESCFVVAAALGACLEAIRQALIAALVAHFDETGCGEARRLFAREDDCLRYTHDPRVPFDNAANRDVRMSKLRWPASDARLDGWDPEGFQADRDGGEMRACRARCRAGSSRWRWRS